MMKFGGTSVADAQQWQRIAQQVAGRQREGGRVLVVCSALAGVTDQLLELAAAPVEADACTDTFDEACAALVQRHVDLAGELGVPGEPWAPQGQALLMASLAMEPGPARSAAVLACGEWFSSQLGAAFLQQAGHASAWVDAREALTSMPEPRPDSPRAWLSARCESHPMPDLEADWASRGHVLVTQGYVARAPDGRTALLGRSGSDTSAALLGTCLGVTEVEIWTDVPGIYTADPRHESSARLIPELAWEEALELAASGARVIHGRSIRAAARAGITLWIRDLSSPSGPGTRITTATPAQGARAVVAKDDMLVLLLRNLDTRQQVGFLAGVFDVISARGLSVDQVSTSETTTTLAIDTATNHLDEAAVAELVAALAPLCEVKTFRDCSCVSVVGRDVRLSLHGLGATADFFARQPLHMMSHSAADRSVSLLVPRPAAAELVHCLHEALVVQAGQGVAHD